jgi:putative nucleotidyltransferase with HDIG domain
MSISRRGSAAVAHGSTNLNRYLPISLVATSIVAGLPLWVLLRPGNESRLLTSFASIALSLALSDLGARVWKRWPGSRDVVFNDLMLWGFCRRMLTQRRLIKRVERLGLSGSNDADGLSREERTDLIKKLAVALETGDPFTHGHSQRVARHAHRVAKTMRLPRELAEKIRLAGVIHDVGKLRTPRGIITKPGKLTDAEFDVIKRHTVDGALMVKEIGDPDLVDMVRHHHERLDGSGYPDRLEGEEISIGARVLAVADTFDAASSLRPYRDAQKHQVALDILQKEAAAGRLDQDVVDAFVRYYEGSRALRWWAFLSIGPANLYRFSMSLGSGVSAAGLAGVAVIGISVIALNPWPGFKADRPDRAGEHRVAISKDRPERHANKGSSHLSGGWDEAGHRSDFSTDPSNGDGRSERSRAKGLDGKKDRPPHAAEGKALGKSEKPENKSSKDKGRPTEGRSPAVAITATVEENSAATPAEAAEQVSGRDPGSAADPTDVTLPQVATGPGKND